MTDQNSQFFAILTAVGEAKQANANALGVPWTFAQMGVGDASSTDPIPSRTQTRLINERRRAPLNQITVDPANSSIIIAEQVIPPDEGGWWIREIGLYDAAGDLVAVANCAPSFKPLLSQGTGKTQVVRLNIVVTSTANVQLKIDPAVVLATREYVDSSILNVLPKNKAAGTYTKVRINDRGMVQEGSNPVTLAGYGITDAMVKGEGGLGAQQPPIVGRLRDIPETRFVATGPDTEDRPPGINYAIGAHVTWGRGEQGIDFLGALNGSEEFFIRHYSAQEPTVYRRVWTEKNFSPSTKADKAQTLLGYGITDAYNKTDTKYLIDQAVAPLAKQATTLAGYSIVDAYTQTQTNTALANAVNALRGGVGGGLDTLQKLALAIGGDGDFATSTKNRLAMKADKANTLAGYSIADAYTQTQTNTALDNIVNALRGGVGGGLDTLQKLALAIGGDGDFATSTMNRLAVKADKAGTLGGYGIQDAYTKAEVNNSLSVKFDKTGGTISGGLTIKNPNQTNTQAGLIVYNPSSNTAWISAALSTDTSAVWLSHRGGENTLYLRDHATQYAALDAGNVLSNGRLCHTARTFMKPVQGQWIPLGNLTTLPSGGTWAYWLAHFNAAGGAHNCDGNVVPGGSVVGSSNSLGFAWRIQ